jgi:glycosyltransferase involved in cell wall biosynthesis
LSIRVILRVIGASSEYMTLKKTSVGVFLPALAGGGAEKAMLHLAHGLAERGIKTDLVLAEAEGDYLEQVPSDVRLIDLKSKFPIVLSKTLALQRYLQREQPTVLFSALDIVSSSLWAKWSSRVPTRVVMCVQTYLSEQFRHDESSTLKKLRPQMVRWLYPRSDELVAASKGTAADLAQITDLPLDRIRVIYNPVVTPEVLQKSQAPVDHPWFAPGELPVILGVGRLVNQKDFFNLINAFAQVRRMRPARLMILGEGEQRQQLEDLILSLGLENDVAMPGFVDNPYAYMSKAAVFALSSKYEGFGNVVAEAIATGTPVVSTDCPSGPAEILDNGNYGKLVPVSDPTALAKAILETLDHPIDPEILKRRSLQFSTDCVVDQYMEVLERITQNN